jgi:glutamate racemase
MQAAPLPRRARQRPSQPPSSSREALRTPDGAPLHRPIAVFDAGIGSYGIVEVIRRHLPTQDLIYFADRASFPYGAKSREALAASVTRAIARLIDLGASAIVLASNAPSVMVLDEIADAQAVPVLGIYPPVRRALETSRTGCIAVLGVASLIDSAEIRAFVTREAQGQAVALVNASALVQRVEDGSFLTDRAATQEDVARFVAALRNTTPCVDVCTLSSTHLPWLARDFAVAAPDITFLDPADSLIPKLLPHATSGQGRTICIATESTAMPIEGLRQMLATLGVDLVPQLVHP